MKDTQRQGVTNTVVNLDEANNLIPTVENLDAPAHDVHRVPTEEQMPRAAKVGEWTDVQRGMMPAVGVEPHPDQETYPGVLVMADVKRDDGSLVVVCWHNKGCPRTGIAPGAVRFDKNGAPWCPTCFAENLARDPEWNSPDEEPTATITPEPQKISDTHRKNQKALKEKRFREPVVASVDEVVSAPMKGDDNFVARPPERFDG